MYLSEIQKKRPGTFFTNQSCSSGHTQNLPPDQRPESYWSDESSKAYQPMKNTHSQIELGSPDAPQEKDADQMAQRVIDGKMSGRPLTNTPTSDNIRRSAPKAGSGGKKLPRHIQQNVLSKRNHGNALQGNVRASMERAFGTGFQDVRIHNDNESDRLNKSLNSRAFTFGQDIFFSEKAYSPESKAGQHLLAHELSHVVQQNDHLFHSP